MLVRLRRLVQAASLILFLYLFLQAVYKPVNQTGKGVKLFFQIDPLALVTSRDTGLWLSLVTLGVTLLAGRWFCGWICPFGALHNLLTAWRRSPVKQRIAAGGYSVWQKSRYYVLAAVLAGAVLGLNLAGWLDPFSLFYRSLAVVLYPAGNDASLVLFTWLYDTDPGLGKLRVTAVSEPVYEFLRQHALAATQPHYYGAAAIALLFIATVLLNLYRARFWCRYVCPLGALLGLAGRNPLVRLKTDETRCNHCGLCRADCQGGANPNDWKASECFYCGNCQAACPKGALKFSFGPFSWRAPRAARINLGRRGLLVAGGAGVGAVLVARAGAQVVDPALVRPPGALPEEAFLTRCIRCGACMKVCPTNAIQPAAGEAGWSGLWTPVLKMKAGYCEYECTLCSQVCPTGAIRPLTVEAKQQIRIGTAFFDRNRCLPYASARTCMVCEEHCPTPKKAIWFEEVQVMTPAGVQTTVKQPRVNPELCVG